MSTSENLVTFSFCAECLKQMLLICFASEFSTKNYDIKNMWTIFECIENVQTDIFLIMKYIYLKNGMIYSYMAGYVCIYTYDKVNLNFAKYNFTEIEL